MTGRVLLLISTFLLAIASDSRAAPLVAGYEAPAARGATEITLVQLNDAGSVWETIKETDSPAVLNVFIARYKDTKYAELARARLEKVLPKDEAPPISSLSAEASAEEMFAEVPTSPEMLRLIETSGALQTGVPTTVKSYETAESEIYSRSDYSQTTSATEHASVRPVRGSLVRLDKIEKSITEVPQASVTTKWTRQSIAIQAANGLLLLASKKRLDGRPVTDQTTTLTSLRNLEGQLYPLRKGSQISFEATYKEVDVTSLEQFTERTFCRVDGEQDAARIHPALTGRAYTMTCRYDTAYKGSKRYTGAAAAYSGTHHMLFAEKLGIWLRTGSNFTIKNFQLR